jgi:hypothetical protein
MCGIAGVFLGQNHVQEVLNGEARYDIGGLLVKMSAAQQQRGTASFGVALYSPQKTKAYRIMVAFHRDVEKKLEGVTEGLNAGAEQSYSDPFFGEARGVSDYLIREYSIDESKKDDLLKRLLSLDRKDFWIVGHGNFLTILKDRGKVNDLAIRWFDPEGVLEYLARHDFDPSIGNIKKPWKDARYATHGIAHVRFPTFSTTSLINSHPQGCPNVGEICVISNGELTNAPRLREVLDLKRYDFFSKGLDTEVIASFIGNRMVREGGTDLETACREFVEVASGFYTFLVATPSEVAFVQDPSKTRPASYGYHPADENFPAFHAIATDTSALEAVGAEERELGEGEVKIFKTGIPFKPEKIQAA